MSLPRHHWLKTAIAWAASSVVGMALAAATVGFAGWCLAGSVGAGLEFLGWTEAGDAFSKAGAVTGATGGTLAILLTVARSRGGEQDEDLQHGGEPDGKGRPCG